MGEFNNLPSEGWRAYLKDGTFVEGLRGDMEHVHYDPRGGSVVPVHWRDQVTGEGGDLRNTPIGEAFQKIQEIRSNREG